MNKTEKSKKLIRNDTLKKYKKNVKGITLIALVVTIIVLLILAGVAINLSIGQNGLISRAINARDEVNKKTAIEEVQLEIAGSINDNGNFDTNIAANNLKNNLNIETTQIDDGSLIFYYKGQYMAVNNEGELKISDQILNISSNHTPVTLNYSWDELEDIAKAISDNYSIIINDTMEIKIKIDENEYILGVGDLTTVDYNGTSKEVRIIGFNHDKLSMKESYGGNNIYAGISFEFVDSLTNMRMNSTNSNLGGWKETELRKNLNDDSTGLINNLNIKNYIKKVKKDYIEVYNDKSSVKESEDYLWLLSCSEIWNNGRDGIGYGFALTNEGKQYKYYKEINANSNNEESLIVKNQQGWWLRSPFRDFRDGFCFVDKNGLASCIAANKEDVYVVPGFSI